MPAVSVNAETLARQCRDEAERHTAASERFLAGAQLMQGVDGRVATQKSQDAIYEAGRADAYNSIAVACERLCAETEEVAA